MPTQVNGTRTIDKLIPLLDIRRSEIEGFCRKYRVKTLEVFGSAVDGSWDPMTSDLDFLVDFESLPPGQLFDHYFDLKDQLQTMFQRRVDLVSPDGIRNPIFLEAVNASRRVLYAA